jgi:outer membrane immunogenic protein
MMKRILLSTVALTMVTGAASAADLSVRARPANVYKAAPMVSPVATWTGCYIGAHGGFGWGEKKFDDGDSLDLDGALAGGQIGCDWQYDSNWVFGIAASGSWSDVNGNDNDEFSAKAQWFATATARLGYSFGQSLLYVKGGAAWVEDKYNFDGDDQKQNRFGWTVGAGLEYMFAPNWSMFAEYNYMDFGNKNVSFFSGENDFDIKQTMHVVKAGINYRFGGPVVARY